MQTLLVATTRVAPMTTFDWIISLAAIVVLLVLIGRAHQKDYLCKLESKKAQEQAQMRRRRHQERKAQEVNAHELVN
jgi:hypothetical protein